MKNTPARIAALCIVIFAVAMVFTLFLLDQKCVPERAEQPKAGEQNTAGVTNPSEQDSPFVKLVKAIYEGQKAQQKSESGGQKYGNWAKTFFCDIKITDFLIAALTILLVGIGGWQGYEVHRTVNAAQGSADAAVKTAMPVLYPAVVGMGGLHPLEVEGDGPVSFAAGILVLFENFGRSAGSIRQVRGDLILTVSGQLPEVPDHAARTVHGYAVMVPPGDTEGPEIGALDVRQDFTLTRAEFQELLAEGRGSYRRFAFLGQVIYDDFFGLRHTSRFCVKMRLWRNNPAIPNQVAVFQVPDGGSRYNWVTSEQIPKPDPLSA